MARTVYEHLLRLTGDNSGLVRAADGSTAAIKRLDESSRRGQAALDKYNSSLQVSARASNAFARSFGGITIGLVAREFVQAADSMTLLEGRLRLVTTGTTQLVATQKELFNVAQDSRASLEATTSFYVRLAQRLGDVSTGTLELSEVTELVSKSLKIGGASAKETSASLLQLSQALSSGLLRGDEFRSLSENAVGLMDAIARGANVTQGELRKLSIEGKLTTEFILDALERSAPSIRKQFDAIPVTFGDAIQRLQNIAVQGIADLNKEFNLTGNLVSFVELLGENVDKLATAFISLAAVKAGRTFSNITASIVEARKQTALETAAIQNNERAIIAETTARLNKAKVDQAQLVRQKQTIAGKIRETEINLALAKSDGARAVQLSRLSTLETQQAALRKQLTASTTALVAAETASAAAKRNLASSAGLLSTAMGGLRSITTFLGGPLGIALLATQALFLFDVFGDGEKQITLNARSYDKLQERIRGLNGLTFEQLELEKKKVEAQIKQQEADGLSTEAAGQRLEILRQLNDEIDANIALTLEGAEQNVNTAVAELNAFSQRVAAAREAVSANQSWFGSLEVSEQLLNAEKEAAEKVHEALAILDRLRRQSNENTGDIAREKLIESLRDEASALEGKRVELRRLRELQAETIKNDELSADAQKVLSERIKKLSDEINGRNTRSANQLSITEKLEKKERDLRKEIEELRLEHQRSGKEVSKYSVELEKKRKELNNHLGIVPDVAKEIKKLTDKYQSGEITIKEYEAALKKLDISQAEFEKTLRDSGATFDKAEAALRELSRAQEDQLQIQRIAATQGEVAAEVYEQLVKVAREHGLTVEELKERYPDLVEAQARFIEQREGIESVNSAIEDFSTSLADAIVDGEDLGDFFKNLWKQMVKDFLASGITKLIGSLVSGNGWDFSGFTTGASGGGSSLGGIVGGLLGGNTDGNTGGGGSQNQGGSVVNSLGSSLGLTDQQTQAVIGGAASLVALYNGYQQIENGNTLQGAVQSAGGLANTYDSYQQLVGGQQLSGTVTGGIGLAGNVVGFYNGIQQGGVEGYGSAAINAWQGYQNATALYEAYQAGQAASTFAQTARLGSDFASYTQWANSVELGQGTAALAETGGAVQSTGAAATQGGTFATGAGAAAAWIAAGVLADEYLNDGRVQNAFGVEAEGRIQGWKDLFDGNFAAFRDSQFQAPYDAIKATFAARPSDQILLEDYLPDLLGIHQGQARGNNAAVFGANFGIRGSGLTAQHLADGGANGNGGFFTGAQSSLDGFAEVLQAAGFDMIKNELGVLKVFDKEKTVEDILELWETYNSSLDGAVEYSEVFKTAIDNNLLAPSNLFFENFAIGFSQSAFEARDSLLLIDERFDELTANGIAATDALFQSISEHYGIAIEDAQFFVEQTGVSVDQWVENFTDASDQALTELLNFNDDGVTAFEAGVGSLDQISSTTVNNIGQDFTGLTGTFRSEAQEALLAYRTSFGDIAGATTVAINTVSGEFVSLTDTITEQAETSVSAYLENLGTLEGALGNVNLGSPRVGQTTITVRGDGQNQEIGRFNSALSGSETVNIGGSGIGTVNDELYTIGLNTRESITVNKKGMIERIEQKIDRLNGIGGSGDLVNEIRNLVIVMQAQNQELEFLRGAKHGDFG